MTCMPPQHKFAVVVVSYKHTYHHVHHTGGLSRRVVLLQSALDPLPNHGTQGT